MMSHRQRDAASHKRTNALSGAAEQAHRPDVRCAAKQAAHRSHALGALPRLHAKKAAASCVCARARTFMRVCVRARARGFGSNNNNNRRVPMVDRKAPARAAL